MKRVGKATFTFICWTFLIFGHFSCVSYRDFSKEYGITKPHDYTDPDVYQHFELGEEYRIKSKIHGTLDVAIIQVHENHLEGIPLRLQKDTTIEIPFEDIVQAKKKDYKREKAGILKSIPMITIMAVVLLTATLLTLTVSNQ
jgi:hypothetical protein